MRGNEEASATASPTPSATLKHHSNTNTTTFIIKDSSESLAKTATEESIEVDGEPVATPFMSFEDWKEMVLRRTGQDPQELDARKQNLKHREDRIPPVMGDFGLGEDEEIALNFDNYIDNTHHDKLVSTPDSDQDTIEYHSAERGKDAGKTCKERFSFSSFDAGATVLKTGPGTKNAKAILVENKDSYMLLECSKQSKYIIVELSDDIWIDTVVLANFEFFSSMIRHFRVSVSDRYPIKLERWRDIGTFEARNSRDIQPFLVENPQIWAKYVRVEFLTHYGKEYYCPVSLLRVHGNRMMDSWKDSETGGEDDATDQEVANSKPGGLGGSTTKTGRRMDGVLNNDENETRFNTLAPVPIGGRPIPKLAGLTSHSVCSSHPFYVFAATCHQDSTAIKQEPFGNARDEDFGSHLGAASFDEENVYKQPGLEAFVNSPGSDQGGNVVSAASTPLSPSIPNQDAHLSTNNNFPSTDASVNASSLQVAKSSATANSGIKNKNGGNPSTTGAPQAQEGFFNVIAKRLHHVETNLTLSLQYLEDQSKYVQESLQKAEQKQLTKVANFLANLNQTVFAELRGMRDQYDQIWQSTVIALESQRDQSDRDMVALSSRLNLLADEVVFQKRMAIVQAVLLLCCLFLVIFSRGTSLSYIAPLFDQNNVVGTYAATQGHHREFDSYGNSMRRDEDHASDDDFPHLHSGRVANYENPDLTDVSPEIQLYSRLSPPLTPGFHSSDENHFENAASSIDFQRPLARRSAPYHQASSRKPLPALPEHPSPPVLDDQSSSIAPDEMIPSLLVEGGSVASQVSSPPS